MAAKYFDQGLAYFAALEKPNVTVFMNEERFSMEIGGHPFTGIVDLLVMDDATGEMILIDHKSKSLRTIRKEKQA